MGHYDDYYDEENRKASLARRETEIAKATENAEMLPRFRRLLHLNDEQYRLFDRIVTINKARLYDVRS